MSLNRGPGLCYGPATVSGLKLPGAAGALVLVAAAATAASPGGDRTRALRLQVGTLGARAHSAELDLYALDSQLGAAQSELATLDARAAQLRAEQQQLSIQLSATRRALAVSQQQLATNLRLLYEQGEPDPLAVVLGAQSLDDAVTKLDALHRVTDQSKRFVDDSTAARTQLAHLQDVLTADGARIESSVQLTVSSSCSNRHPAKSPAGSRNAMRSVPATRAKTIGACFPSCLRIDRIASSCVNAIARCR